MKHIATHNPKAKLPVNQQGFRDWLDDVGGVQEESLVSKCEEEGRI